MTRHKGMSRKQAITVDDLTEIIDCYRRIQAIHAGLNHESSQKLPLMAASATLKACWAELSGSSDGWAYPDWGVKAPDPNKVIPKTGPMYRFGLDNKK